MPGKTKGAFLLAGWQSKKALFSFFRLFGYNQFLVIWGLRPRTNSGQVSWLKAQHPPPPSRNMRSSDRCSCTLAVNSPITVTRSCGICTRFPFTLSAVQCIGKRHLPFFCSVRPALYHKTAQNAIKNGILPFYKEGCRLEIEPNAELTGAHGSH